MKIRSGIRAMLGFGLGIAFISVGIDHFIHPSWYEPIVPEILPSPRFWVLLSGLFEAGLGLMLIIPKTRSLAALGIAWMLVVLYWANFNMWYNDIPLNGTHYDDVWHILRLVIQIFLIILLTWIGEITPFKGKERAIDSMDVFQGRITSCGFESGDRIVVGDWVSSPFGKFTDIMWATKEGKRILIAPNNQISDYVQSLYTFDEIVIEEISVTNFEGGMKLTSESLNLEYRWSRGWTIPFSRSLFFIATVESLFAKLFFGTRTHGITKNGRKEWYAIDRVSSITNAIATINSQDAGGKRAMKEPCKFGFSEAPNKPSSCEVRAHIL
ncbi:MAG: DoxX family membrane protein [Euryarchaeota archaeon]|nr:DoxX family membrane protein [Euryarchaeota archaeon]MBT4982038.1 DoxX family membrane protein [Euryarchaeota archaeon]MBT5184624.1 DoxX family membrane protein [Euryarchaeota archaeon]